MKRIIAWILAAVLLLSCSGLAEMDVLSGNISTGGIAAAGDEGDMYFALDALLCMHSDGEIYTVTEGETRDLQYANGRLYFVSSEMVGEDEFSEKYLDTLCVLNEDGVVETIGDPLRRGVKYEYSEDYNYTRYDSFNGYRNMTVYKDHIYYIGNSAEGGSYETVALNWDDAEGETRYATEYTNGGCVYRMDLDGSNKIELISGLGNGTPHMAICNDRIAVASCFQNSVYAYDFSNFMLYDLEGKLLETKANASENRHASLYKDDQEFTVIINAIQTDGEAIYASLGDSEGDFASSRFVNVESMDDTIAYEAWYTTSLNTDDGLIYMGSDVQGVFWDEALETSVRLIRRAADGSETTLAYFPSDYIDYDMKLALVGGMVFVRTGDRLLRVNLENGDVDEFNGSIFSVCAPCDPAFAGSAQEIEAAEEPEATEEPELTEAPEATEEPAVAEAPEATEAPAAAEPEATKAPELVLGPQATAEPEEDPTDEYLLPDSDTRIYTRKELAQYDKDTLALMRNEILARHGYPFKKEQFREYFGSKSWYTEDPNFVYDCLNHTEMTNVETIKSLE